MAEIVRATEQTGPKDLENEALVFTGGYDTAGRAIEYKIKPPVSVNFGDWPLMVQVAMLKMGTFKNSSIPEIIFATAYAKNLGLDITQGDVYPTGSGRIGTSNKAKIKLALATGNVVGIKSEITDTKTPVTLAGCTQKTELMCTATIKVKGWDEPIVVTQKLSDWFMPSNPNWKSRPEHMLRLNTIAHACEFVAPGATDENEAPPLNQVSSALPIAVEAQFTEAKGAA